LTSDNRGLSKSIALSRIPITFQARDTPKHRHEIPRTKGSYPINEDTTPEGVDFSEAAEVNQVHSSSCFTDEISHLHYTAYSNNQATSTLARLQLGLDDEQWQAILTPSMDYHVDHAQLHTSGCNDETSTASQPLRQRWFYETSNENITIAESLEKPNWEGSRMERL
jgi:hypothetical protein